MRCVTARVYIVVVVQQDFRDKERASRDRQVLSVCPLLDGGRGEGAHSLHDGVILEVLKSVSRSFLYTTYRAQASLSSFPSVSNPSSMRAYVAKCIKMAHRRSAIDGSRFALGGSGRLWSLQLLQRKSTNVRPRYPTSAFATTTGTRQGSMLSRSDCVDYQPRERSHVVASAVSMTFFSKVGETKIQKRHDHMNSPPPPYCHTSVAPATDRRRSVVLCALCRLCRRRKTCTIRGKTM